MLLSGVGRSECFGDRQTHCLFWSFLWNLLTKPYALNCSHEHIKPFVPNCVVIVLAQMIAA